LLLRGKPTSIAVVDVRDEVALEEQSFLGSSKYSPEK
jgi:hypothetical protein